MSASFPDEQREIYRKNFLEFGDSPEGVFWNNRETQHLRFERLLRNFDLSRPFSIHDVGCGTCELHKYLLEKKIAHDYHGTEIVPEMIALAKKKFSGITISDRDILSRDKLEMCDIGVVSGTFNYGGSPDRDGWKKYVFRMIKKIFEFSNSGAAFNFLTAYNTFSHPTLFYFSPAEVLDFCMKNLSRFVIVDHAYPLYEFTVTVLQEDNIKGQFPGAVYKKYFTE